MTPNRIDPQTVPVRCATQGGVPYIYVEPANSGTVDGTAELVFVVTEGCDVTLVEVSPSSNCRVVRQAVREKGRVLAADIAYQIPGRSSTSLTYTLWVRDAAGLLQQAYGDKLTGDQMAATSEALSAAKGSAPTRHPPPEIQFP